MNLGDNLTKNTRSLDTAGPEETLQNNGKEEPPLEGYSSKGRGAGALGAEEGSALNNSLADGKQWIVLPLPATYSATNWPIRVSEYEYVYPRLSSPQGVGFGLLHKWYPSFYLECVTCVTGSIPTHIIIYIFFHFFFYLGT